MPDKPYPWTCGECATETVQPTILENYLARRLVGDQMVTVNIPQLNASKCTTCGNVYFSLNTGRQIDEALLELLKCLKPSEPLDTAPS